jgi:aldehyde dehydrogenase (NAD+)
MAAMTTIEHAPVSTPVDRVAGVVAGARAHVTSGRTKPMAWRLATLRRLRELTVEHEPAMMAALAADLGKARLEAFTTEVGFCLNEIDLTLDHLESWAKPERVTTPLTLQPGSSHVVREPLGLVCVIAPWNYPFQLLLAPVIAAVSAGNGVVAKPSELAPATAVAVAALLADLADPAIVTVLGGVAETTELLAQPFDHIFYTGNGRVARVVMRAAAEHLTPVTLELGGKSPAIVSRHAKLDVAARRIAFGKFTNAGQTCVAPDYVLVERPVQHELVRLLGVAVQEMYGDDPRQSPDYGRIVSPHHVERLSRMLDDGGLVAFGGIVDAEARYVAPTVLTGVSLDSVAMGEEIFGPILPIIGVDSLDEATAIVGTGDKPLALYVFSEHDDEVERVIGATTSGGVTVNGTLFHVANPYLPFGGVGPSGTGAYHGRWGFETFSHRRAVYTRGTRLDPSMLYPPFTAAKERLVRRGLSMPDPRQLPARALARWRARRA